MVRLAGLSVPGPYLKFVVVIEIEVELDLRSPVGVFEVGLGAFLVDTSVAYISDIGGFIRVKVEVFGIFLSICFLDRSVKVGSPVSEPASGLEAEAAASEFW